MKFLAQYEDFLQRQCANCSLSLPKNRIMKMSKNLMKPSGNTKLNSLFSFSGEDITNFEAISLVYGLTHKILADKLAECFKNVSITDKDLILEKDKPNEDVYTDTDQQYIELCRNKLSFCGICEQHFEEMYQVNRKLRSRSNKNSLLCKSLNQQFCIIEDRGNVDEEHEIKCENESVEECLLEDPLSIGEQEEADSFLQIDYSLKEEFEDNNDYEIVESAGCNSQSKWDETDVSNVGPSSSLNISRHCLRSATKSHDRTTSQEEIEDSIICAVNEESYSDGGERELVYSSEGYTHVSKRLKAMKRGMGVRAKKSEVARCLKQKKAKEQKSVDSKGYTLIPLENCASKTRKYNYSCNECGKLLPTISSMCSHLSFHVDANQLTVYSENIEGPPYSCPKCARSFHRTVYLKMHCLRIHKLKIERQFSEIISQWIVKNDDILEEDSSKLPYIYTGSIKGPPFECILCDAKFKGRGSLKVHFAQVHDIKLPDLIALKKMSRSKSNEIKEDGRIEKAKMESEHCKEIQGEKSYCEEPYFCRECNFGFKSRHKVVIHLRKAHNTKNRFDCRACDDYFDDLTDLLRHLENVHQEIVRPEERRDSFRCDDCPNEVFDSLNILKKHLNISNHTTLKITCAFCESIFSDLASLKIHKKIVHKKILNKIESRNQDKTAASTQDHRQYKCPFCDKTFPNMIKMYRHRSTHPKEERIYRCTQCTNTFTNYSKFQYHVHTLHNEEKFQCSDCGRTIVGIRTFRRHCKRHAELASGVKQLCDLCGKSFATKILLSSHKIRIHFETNKHQCHICGYVSVDKSTMNKHMKVHAKNGSIRRGKQKYHLLE